MSLIYFHRFLIACGILFCAGFAVWTYLAYLRTGGVWTLSLAVVFAAAAISLTYYLARLRRFVKYPRVEHGSEADAPHHEPW